MGTAFSSSLFGLAGALVLGFLDLQAGHAQNRFYNDLEEWLASQTRLAGGALGGDGEGSVPAYIQALLEQTSDSLDKLQRIMARSEEERRNADQRLIELTEEVPQLAEQSRSEQKGVMGLTRAFHMAGARNVVASLWKVDDAATRRLMERFCPRLSMRS